MALKFQKVRIGKVTRETHDAVSIGFINPDKQVFNYIPGQYLTLKVEVDGKKYNRAYSLSSCPFTDELLTVTVKVSEGGKVSTFLNSNSKEGMEIEVLPPLGNFTAKIDPSNQKHYVLIGAGSGVTPLMSILRSVLEKEPQSKVTLIYGNRNQDSIVFKSVLDGLLSKHSDRLKVVHSLSQPQGDWNGESGRLTKDKVKALLSSSPEDSLPKEYYICGPSGMMEEAARGLKEMNIPSDCIHEEHFSAPLTHIEDEEKPKEENSNTIIARQIRVILDGIEKEVSVPASASILDAVLDHDLDPPYACMIGSCCTCKAKLLSGKVVMDDREGLTDSEIADGFVLTCQSHPLTSDVLVSYDEI